MNAAKPKIGPKIGISSCILGHHVRYDGDIKSFPEICDALSQHFELVSVCPEVEIGLSVPRPPVQLSENLEHPKMTGRDDPSIDVTDSMYQFCNSKPQQLTDLCGYIFKSKSPSCGVRNIPVFGQDEILSDNHRGLFAHAMMTLFPDMPIVDETELASAAQRNQFIQLVLNYYKDRPPHE